MNDKRTYKTHPPKHPIMQQRCTLIDQVVENVSKLLHEGKQINIVREGPGEWLISYTSGP